MKAQIVEQVELFSEAELESLEFLPEELEAIEEQRVPDLDSISFEDIAEELEAYFEGDMEGAELEGRGGEVYLEGNKFSRPSSPRPRPRRLPPEIWLQIMPHMTWERYQAVRRVMGLPDATPAERRRMMNNSLTARLAASRRRR